MAKSFSPEKYYNDGEWKKVIQDGVSFYELLGFALTDQLSAEDIDRAHEARWKWWKAIRQSMHSAGSARFTPKVEEAGPMVEEAIDRLRQAKETLRDKDKRKAYDQILLKEKHKPLIDYLDVALHDQILSEEEKQNTLRLAAKLGIDQVQAEELIAAALERAGATYQREPTSAANFYKQLGVPDFSDYPEIKKKYDEEHAAYIQSRVKAAAKFRWDKVSEAFDVLKDPNKKREHDEKLRAPKSPVPPGAPVLTLVPAAPKYEFKNIKRGATLSETIVIKNPEAGLLQGDIKADADAMTWLRPDRNRLLEQHEQPLAISIVTASIPRTVFHVSGTVTITTNGGIGKIPFDVFLEDYGTELGRFRALYVPLYTALFGLVGSLISGTHLIWLIWPSVLLFAVWYQVQRIVDTGIVRIADRIRAVGAGFVFGAVGGGIVSVVGESIAPSSSHLTGFVIGAWVGGSLSYLLAQQLFKGGIAPLSAVPHSSLILRSLSIAFLGIAMMMPWREGGREPATSIVSTPQLASQQSPGMQASLHSRLGESDPSVSAAQLALREGNLDEAAKLIATLKTRRSNADAIKSLETKLEEAQKAVATGLSNARELLRGGQLDDAGIAIDSVIALEKKNAQAVRLRNDLHAKEQERDKALRAASECLKKADYRCARDKAAQAKLVDSGSGEAARLLEQVDALIASNVPIPNSNAPLPESSPALTPGAPAPIAATPPNPQEASCLRVVEAGEGALRKNAYAVARQAAEQALGIWPNCPGANSLRDRAMQGQTQIEIRISGNLREAAQCLQNEDSVCADAKLKEVLRLDPDNERARRGLESIDIAKRINRCSALGDLDCMELGANDMLRLDPQHQGAKNLLQQIAAKRGQRQASPGSPRSTGPPGLQAREKSIDDQYNERAAQECARGALGLICRESLKMKLCDGRWTAGPAVGQSLCKRIETQAGNTGS